MWPSNGEGEKAAERAESSLEQRGWVSDGHPVLPV